MHVLNDDRSDSDSVVRGLAKASLNHLTVLSERLVDQVWEDVYLARGPVPKNDLLRSCRDNLGSVLTVLAGTGPSAGELMRSARATGTRRAQQRCPLPWVLHAWRVGGQLLWEDLAERAGAEDRDELRRLVASAATVWGVTEEFSAEVAATYHRVEQQLTRSADHRLYAMLDAVLDGRHTGAEAEAYRALSLRRNDRLAVLVAEEPPNGTASVRRLRDALLRHGVHSVWRPRAGTHVALAALGDRLPSDVAELLAPYATSRVGLSSVVTDLGEVPAACRMARLAMTLVPMGGAGAVALDDRLPDALLLSSPELAQRLVNVTLGPLLALPRDEREELLHTISAWVRSMGSSVRAAKLLYCHRNTVLNRLRKVETLTKLDLTATAAWPQVMLALAALSHGMGSTEIRNDT